MLGSKIAETADGIFHSPINIRRELIILSVALAGAVLLAVYLGRATSFTLLIWIAVTLIFAFWRYRQFKCYGPMGPPSVSIANQVLYIDRLNDSNGGVTMPLHELERIVVYGQIRRRIFRLVKNDNSFVEITPQWNAALEQKAIQFLTHVLPDKVTVEDPQSMFASVRGDGPYTDA